MLIKANIFSRVREENVTPYGNKNTRQTSLQPQGEANHHSFAIGPKTRI